jgi:hypothetical protein
VRISNEEIRNGLQIFSLIKRIVALRLPKKSRREIEEEWVYKY